MLEDPSNDVVPRASQYSGVGPSSDDRRFTKAATICKPLKTTYLASSFETMSVPPSAIRLGPANVVDPQFPFVMIAVSVATWLASISRQPESFAKLISCNWMTWVRICFAILEPFFGGVASALSIVRMSRGGAERAAQALTLARQAADVKEKRKDVPRTPPHTPPLTGGPGVGPCKGACEVLQR